MKRTFTLIVLLVLVSPQLGGCAEVNPGYSIYDSGKPGVGISGWLDNDTVVFYSEQRAQIKPGTQGPPPVHEAGYYVWDTAKGTVSKDSSLEDAAKVCVQGNVVTFLRKSHTDEKKWLVVTREKGQETVTPLMKTEWFNRFSCRYYQEAPEWAILNHETLPLMEGHGFLDWSSEQEVQPRQNRRIVFCQHGHDEGIKLSIRMRQVFRSTVRYAPFKDAYFLYPIAYVDPQTEQESPVGLWPEGKPVPMWWLAPDGKVTTEEVPYMPFMRSGSRGFFPTREGVFMYTHNTDGLGKPGDAGGYISQNGKVMKLTTGMVEQVSVSPDGCKVAFIHDPYDTMYGKDRLNRITVKATNLCQETDHVH